MMEQDIQYCGTTRISNPRTLQKWIDNGNYQKRIDEGYTFNVGCGRFKLAEKCNCAKCRRFKKPELTEIIRRYEKSNSV